MNEFAYQFRHWTMVACVCVLALIVLSVAVYRMRPLADVVIRFIGRHPIEALFVSPFVLTMFVYGATKQPDPPVITEQGISLVKCVSTPNSVTLEWSTTDERIDVGEDVFHVQRRVKAFPFKSGWSAWKDIATTTETNAVVEGFSVDKNCQYRIAVEKELTE